MSSGFQFTPSPPPRGSSQVQRLSAEQKKSGGSSKKKVDSRGSSKKAQSPYLAAPYLMGSPTGQPKILAFSPSPQKNQGLKTPEQRVKPQDAFALTPSPDKQGLSQQLSLTENKQVKPCTPLNETKERLVLPKLVSSPSPKNTRVHSSFSQAQVLYSAQKPSRVSPKTSGSPLKDEGLQEVNHFLKAVVPEHADLFIKNLKSVLRAVESQNSSLVKSTLAPLFKMGFGGALKNQQLFLNLIQTYFNKEFIDKLIYFLPEPKPAPKDVMSRFQKDPHAAMAYYFGQISQRIGTYYTDRTQDRGQVRLSSLETPLKTQSNTNGFATARKAPLTVTKSQLVKESKDPKDTQDLQLAKVAVKKAETVHQEEQMTQALMDLLKQREAVYKKAMAESSTDTGGF